MLIAEDAATVLEESDGGRSLSGPVRIQALRTRNRKRKLGSDTNFLPNFLQFTFM